MQVGPFEITKIVLAQECYVDKKTLQAYNLRVFTGTFKTKDDKI